jgi:DNA helicase HerA-like ATPase
MSNQADSSSELVIGWKLRDSELLRKGLLPKERKAKKDLADLANVRLQVVDLPSIDEARFRLLTVSTLLEFEWIRARRKWESALPKEADKDFRVPTFIIVDEAHNLIPADPRNHNETRLREQFRTIAAEGRKFGLFLILVSQRPDKLDPWVLSECANRAVMKIGSEAGTYRLELAQWIVYICQALIPSRLARPKQKLRSRPR